MFRVLYLFLLDIIDFPTLCFETSFTALYLKK